LSLTVIHEKNSSSRASTVLFLAGKAQPPDKMQWFRDAKLGIFIHWGITI
jgi:hypothetical protein